MAELPAPGPLYRLVFPYLLKAALVFVFVLVTAGGVAQALLATGGAVALMAGVDEWMMRRRGRTVFRSEVRWGRTPLIDRVRQQDFGVMTLLSALLLMVAAPEAESLWLAALVAAFALAVAGISFWRVIEHWQVRKEGVVLSPMQREWLLSVRVAHGHEEAVAELRRLCPKVGSNQADEIIERLLW